MSGDALRQGGYGVRCGGYAQTTSSSCCGSDVEFVRLKDCCREVYLWVPNAMLVALGCNTVLMGGRCWATTAMIRFRSVIASEFPGEAIRDNPVMACANPGEPLALCDDPACPPCGPDTCCFDDIEAIPCCAGHVNLGKEFEYSWTAHILNHLYWEGIDIGQYRLEMYSEGSTRWRIHVDPTYGCIVEMASHTSTGSVVSIENGVLVCEENFAPPPADFNLCLVGLSAAAFDGRSCTSSVGYFIDRLWYTPQSNGYCPSETDPCNYECLSDRRDAGGGGPVESFGGMATFSGGTWTGMTQYRGDFYSRQPDGTFIVSHDRRECQFTATFTRLVRCLEKTNPGPPGSGRYL